MPPIHQIVSELHLPCSTGPLRLSSPLPADAKADSPEAVRMLVRSSDAPAATVGPGQTTPSVGKQPPTPVKQAAGGLEQTVISVLVMAAAVVFF